MGGGRRVVWRRESRAGKRRAQTNERGAPPSRARVKWAGSSSCCYVAGGLRRSGAQAAQAWSKSPPSRSTVARMGGMCWPAVILEHHTLLLLCCSVDWSRLSHHITPPLSTSRRLLWPKTGKAAVLDSLVPTS